MKLSRLSFAGTALTLACMSSLTFGAEGWTQTLEIGASAPDFNLPGINGRAHSLNEFAGPKILMVIFTANHCKPPHASEQRTIHLAKYYPPLRAAILAIAPIHPSPPPPPILSY